MTRCVWCRLAMVSVAVFADRAARSALAEDERLVAAAAVHDAATPLNSSVLLTDESRLLRAVELVDRAADLGNRRVNFVLSIDCELNDQNEVVSFGLLRAGAENYERMTPDLRQHLRRHWQAAFARAVARDVDIAILPHLDAATAPHPWRNLYDFNPCQAYGGFSYEELMVDTLVAALEDTVRGDTEVLLALSGEMGTSACKYPAEYLQMLTRLRQRAKIKRLGIGIAFNHSDVAGAHPPTGPDRLQLETLFDRCDFLGFSNYRPFRVPPTADDFLRSIDHFVQEWRARGVTIPTSKPLHFSEIGVGGGFSDEGPTTDPHQAAQTPWEGTHDADNNPWRDRDMRQMRRAYHRAALDFLARQPARWKVTAAFLWSEGSWDPQGMLAPEFADQEIIEMIQRHNQAAAPR